MDDVQDFPFFDMQSSGASRADANRKKEEPSTFRDLVEVLMAHPGGFRRWSVMRAIRTKRDRENRHIPQKLEDEVERIFRHHCLGLGVEGTDPKEAPDALFYLPKEKAGEVWAIYPERAKLFLETLAEM